MCFYLVEDLVRLFHEKLMAYDFARGLVLCSASTYHFQPFFSQKLMASTLSPNSIFMFDNGSPLKTKKKKRHTQLYTPMLCYLCSCKNMSTHVDVQPIKGFSQRSLLSNSITQLWVSLVPDCITFLVTLLIFTKRVLTCSSGTPVTGLRST